MGRRIYIISKSMKVEDAREGAIAANCPEIVHGIPPALAEVFREQDLPVVFEEPELPPPEPVRDPLVELDELKAELKETGVLSA